MPEQQPQWLNSNNLCYISDGMGKIQIEVARVLSENTIRKWVIDPVESPNRVDRLPWCFSQQFRTKKKTCFFFSKKFFLCVGSDFLHISHVFFGVFPSLWEKISRQVLNRWNKTTLFLIRTFQELTIAHTIAAQFEKLVFISYLWKMAIFRFSAYILQYGSIVTCALRPRTPKAGREVKSRQVD